MRFDQMAKKHNVQMAGWLMLYSLFFLFASCGQPEKVRERKVTILDQGVIGPLSTLSIVGLHGTYEGCKGHSEGSGFFIPVGKASFDGKPDPLLWVLSGDSTCTLWLTRVVFSNKDGSLAPITYYAKLPGISFPDAVFSKDVPFRLLASLETEPTFWGRIRLIHPQPTERFGYDFDIEFSYRNDKLSPIDGPLSYVKVGAIPVTASMIKAPDYGSADFISNAFRIGIDVNEVIVSMEGSLKMTHSIQAGETWVFLPLGAVREDGSFWDPSVYTDVVERYQKEMGKEHPIALGQALMISPEQLGFSIGEHLSIPVTKWIVIKHHDVETSLDTYQTVSFQFSVPAL